MTGNKKSRRWVEIGGGSSAVHRRPALVRCCLYFSDVLIAPNLVHYASLPHLKGESKTASVGCISRIPATDVEDIIVTSVNEHLVAQHGEPSSSRAPTDDRGLIAEQVVRIDVHKDRLMVRLKSAVTEEGFHSTDGQLLSIPWQKPPSRRSRQILIT